MGTAAEDGGGATTRREEIFAVAADIFWTKGYHTTSMNDVADAMGMRKASLYHHVKNKDTLLYEMSVSSMRHMIEAAQSATDAEPEQRLRQVVDNHVKALLDDRSRHATALVELRSLTPEQRAEVVALRSRYDSLIDEVVRAVQNTTDRWPDIPAQLVRMALLGMLNWTVFWFSPEGPASPDAIASAFTAVFLPPGDA